jgi:hypothetical protein
LADFPIPKKLASFEKRLADLARQAIDSRRDDISADIRQLDQKIDALVYEAFGLTADNITVVETVR